MKKQKNILQQLDYGLIFLLFLLSLISFIAIYQATNHVIEGSFYYVFRQMIFYLLGFGIIFASLFFDYRLLKHLSPVLYGLGIILLLWVYFFGIEEAGAQRWVSIAGFNFQPSEIVKLFLVIAIAHMVSKFQEQQQSRLFKDDLWLTVKIGIVTVVPFVIVLLQPDLGTAIVFLSIVAVMLFVAGISWKLLLLLLILLVGIIVGLVFLYFVNFELFSTFIASHQLERIYGWLDPEEHSQGFGLQLLQSLMAIGAGQLMGQSLTGGSHDIRVPEVHTDFIFAVIGQEFGFVGASILISIYFILIYRLVQIALTCNDTFGSYLVSGVIGMLIFQVFQNIAMSIGLMPITGLALPFISYGGSALLTNMIAMGIVLNVNMRTRVYMFD